MGQIGLDGTRYEEKTEQLSRLISEVSGTKNALKSKEDNLDVSGVERIYKLNDLFISLMDSYGAMALHDVGEFKQLGVNIQVLDAKAGGN